MTEPDPLDTGFMSPGLAVVVSLLRFLAEERPDLASQVAIVVSPWIHRAFPELDYTRVSAAIFRALSGGRAKAIEELAREHAESELPTRPTSSPPSPPTPPPAEQ